MKRRYCIPCDTYTNANPCKACGADTDRVPREPLKPSTIVLPDCEGIDGDELSVILMKAVKA